MKGLRCSVWVAALAVLAAGSVAVAAGEKAARGKAAKEPVVSQCDQMIAELNLTDEQQAQVKAKSKAKEAALAKWNEANAEKVRAAEEAAKAARSGTDDAAKKKASADLKALQTERDAATAEADAAILGVLTDEQKAAWQGFQLYQTVAARYKKAELTEEQLAKVKAACAEASKEIQANADDRKAAGEIDRKLRWAIEVVILTPEQRATIPQRAVRTK